jgi:tetratricopeptide (TPR) repeat protein
VLFNAGLLEQKAENHDRAAELYTQAIRKKADLAEAHLNLAVALQSMGEEEKAVASFEEAIRLKPQLAKGYFSLKPMSRSTARPRA